MILAYFYFKYKNIKIIQGVLGGLRPAVVALIASAGFSILVTALWGETGISAKLSDIDPVAVILFAISLFILRKFKVNQIMVMLGTGVAGAAVYLMMGR
jgi:chromate transporter